MVFQFLKNQFSKMRSRDRPKKPLDEEWLHPRLINTMAPSIGLVIGTYGAPAYVALQLEARRRFWGHVPVLVHDDGSPEEPQLRELCRKFGVDFTTTGERHGWSLGDMAAIASGVDWAYNKGLDLVVKVSRRYLICCNWVPGLQELAYSTQYATYGNACAYYEFPFRPECMAMHVRTWYESGVAADLNEHVRQGYRLANNIEKWYQSLVLRIHNEHAPATLKWREHCYPRHPKWSGYGVWTLLGDSRRTPVPGVLWHDIQTADDYYALAQSWGLTELTLSDFQMPTITEAAQTEAQVMRSRNPKFEPSNVEPGKGESFFIKP